MVSTLVHISQNTTRVLIFPHATSEGSPEHHLAENRKTVSQLDYTFPLCSIYISRDDTQGYGLDLLSTITNMYI